MFLQSWLRRSFTRSLSTAARASIVLRPYQESCLTACLAALEAGSTRIGVSLPTGAGKTTVFVSLLSRLSSQTSGSRALIIVNSIELARQAASQAKNLFPHWIVEIEQGAKHQASGHADVTVATYQTLLQPKRLSKFQPEGMKAVIVDEAHHAAAPSYRRILAHFDNEIKSKNTIPLSTVSHSIPIIGFSATFSRHDGLSLGSVFQQIVYHRDFIDMIQEKWLCNIRFTSVHANVDLTNVTVNSRTGDFNASSLADVINTKTVNELIVQTWMDRASERKSTLVFCVNLSHVAELTKTFKSFDVDARFLHSGTPSTERQEVIKAFKAQEFPVLINCAILTEGADIPNIDCVVIARPTKSRNVFTQMVGRGMRQSPSTGKTDCRIIDFVDSTTRVAGVITTPSLFGLDPAEVFDDETVDSLKERVSKSPLPMSADSEARLDSNESIPAPKSVTYTDFEDPLALVDHCSGAPHISRLSNHAWVGCGEDVYVLECLGRGTIRIEKVIDKTEDKEYFQASFAEAVLDLAGANAKKTSPFRRSRQILKAHTLRDALRGCDTYAGQRVLKGHMLLGLMRNAKWRKMPASEAQKELVMKRWAKRDIDPASIPERLEKLTKGEAANIITRLKHGAQVGIHRNKMCV
ncbi:P-loop containing nucleoside triphosphate hydrolase protein [Coniophora puteana RWD-64-598 SS2]|uniref:P-loop containing nucleoside triphosphate hydrolase protein n=1 Tax=Coniophora puteana (strain RWD-64-598) TaxID=741705 RepID=A0A5M3N647_CONPW|nr:P-loop containing nucleoside triphosphate hydrolase protein [Coniophora puteana RWD-64-598 SS2]EIW86776.1 P-loop containing nucleoside triphosphate hydrolase protein [Coniophora puteana RWD-64-598 SS2]